MRNSGIDQLKHSKGQLLYKKAKKLIPGGTQLLSKRPELFAPDVWPSYYSKAKGCRVWDLDDKEYLDMSIMGIGANILGYGDDDVDARVIEAIRKGSSSTLNCPEEVELAELLIKLHPWADMVRYSRSGGEAMAIAVRIARTSTKRDIVLFSGYHGWSDWYLAANLGNDSGLDGQLLPGLAPNGVPRGLLGTALPFHFKDIQRLKDLIRGKEKEIAAIIVEPARGEEAPKDYLNSLREIAGDIGAVLIFDEITSAFRMCTGGIHLRYGINPDIAVFAKSMANGYPMAAIIGKDKVMEAVQSSFISSTNWTERIGPVAALATIEKYIKNRVADHIIRIGKRVKSIWMEASQRYNLPIESGGLPTLASFSFTGDDSQAMNTVFTVEMLKRGFLGFKQFKASFSHTDEDIDLYSQANDEIFSLLASKPIDQLLKTPVAHTGFFRLVDVQ